MASAIKTPTYQHTEYENLIDAFQRLDKRSIKKLARIVGNYYQSTNRN